MGYQGVALPQELLDCIDEKRLVFKSYTSRTDFIKQAIRRELERLTKLEKVVK